MDKEDIMKAKYYYKDGTTSSRELSKVLHREDGPAVVYEDGTSYYYNDGKLHREDGPARVYSNGETYYYVEGAFYTKKQFDRRTTGLLISLKRRLLVWFVRFLLRGSREL